MGRRRKRLHTKSIYIIITLLILFLVIIMIAYSVLNQVLNISFQSVNQAVLELDVGFKIETVSGIPSSNNNTAVCNQVTTTKESVNNINISMTNTNDKCIYELETQNNGSINAKIQSIQATYPNDTSCTLVNDSTFTCGNITYKLRYDTTNNSNTVNVNDYLNASATKKIYLIVEYTGTPEDDDFYQEGFGFTINYIDN